MRGALINIKLWREKGLTLIELLAALALICLVIGVGLTAYLTSQKAVYQFVSMIEVQQTSRSSMQFMTREIRMAQKIMSIQPDTLTLINHDGNKIVYRMTGGTLWRDYYLTPTSFYKSTSHPLANQVTSLCFASYETRGVEVCLTVGQGNREYTLSTYVYPRVD